VEEGREFGIADGMILIAGIAAGMAMVRLQAPGVSWEQVWGTFVTPSQGWSLSYALGLFVELGVMFGIPLLAPRRPPACWSRSSGPVRPGDASGDGPVLSRVSRPPWWWRAQSPSPRRACCSSSSSLSLPTHTLSQLFWAVAWPARAFCGYGLRCGSGACGTLAQHG
jgi:hypothetical protein